VVVACRLATAGPCHPSATFPTRDVRLTKHQREFPGSRPIPVLSLACGHHGWGGGPWAFPQAPHPTDQEPATHVAVGTGRTQPVATSSTYAEPPTTSSLTTCDLDVATPAPTRRLPLYQQALRPEVHAEVSILAIMRAYGGGNRGPRNITADPATGRDGLAHCVIFTSGAKVNRGLAFLAITVECTGRRCPLAME